MKTKTAVCIGIYNVLKQAKVMLTSLTENITVPYDLIIFYDELSIDAMKTLRKFNCKQFIPFSNFKKEEQTSRFSHMTFCKFECFKLLESYEQVLWLDCDLVVDKSIDDIFNYSGDMCCVSDHIHKIRNNFRDISKLKEPVDLNNQNLNAGVLLLRDTLPYDDIRLWCYRKTNDVRENLFFGDQGIINLIPYYFKIEVTTLPDKYNVIQSNEIDDLKEAVVVHFAGKRNKPFSKLCSKNRANIWKKWEDKCLS